MDILTYISHNFLAILGLGGYVVAGIFAFTGIFNAQTNARRKENDALTASLIENLDRKAKEQAEELNLMRQHIKDHTDERNKQLSAMEDNLKSLTAKNEVLENLFKGRDPEMQHIFKEAPTIFAIARENNVISKSNSIAITQLTQVITEFIETLKEKL